MNPQTAISPLNFDLRDVAEFFTTHLPQKGISLEEAAELSLTADNFLSKIDEAAIFVKLWRGAHLSAALPDSHQEKYGENIAGKVLDAFRAAGHRVSETTIYEEASVYEDVMKNCGDWFSFVKWVNGQRASGMKITWALVKSNFTDSRKRPEQIYGSKKGAKNVALRATENAVEKMEYVAELEREGDEDAAGVATAVRHSLDELQSRHAERLLYDKKVEYEDPKFLEWVRHQPCIISGALPDQHPIDPAHLWSGVMGSKKSDYCAVPLLHSLHAEAHQMGIESFCKKYGVDPYRLAFNNLYKYITGKYFDIDP